MNVRVRPLLAFVLIQAFLLAPPAGASEPQRSLTFVSYATKVAGLTVMTTDADVEMDARGYRVDIATRTAGAYGLMFRGETRTMA